MNLRLRDVAKMLMKYSIYAKIKCFLSFLFAKNFHILSIIQNLKNDFHIALPVQVKGAKCFLEVASSVWIYFGIGSVHHLVELHLCWKMNISDRIWGRDCCKLQFSCYFRDLPRSEETLWENENIICCNEVFFFLPQASTIYFFFLLTDNHTKEDTSAF